MKYNITIISYRSNYECWYQGQVNYASDSDFYIDYPDTEDYAVEVLFKLFKNDEEDYNYAKSQISNPNAVPYRRETTLLIDGQDKDIIFYNDNDPSKDEKLELINRIETRYSEKYNAYLDEQLRKAEEQRKANLTAQKIKEEEARSRQFELDKATFTNLKQKYSW